MGFPPSVKERAAVACNRSCCICHNFKGPKLEFHHIKQQADGGDNSFENCIPLCFDCHADMGKTDLRHPKRNHYSEKELKMHRDKWYEQCSAKTDVLEEITKEDIKTLFENKPLVLDYGNAQENQNNVISVEMRNAAGGHTVIIDDEKYIAERIVEEHDREILRLLKEI